MAARNLVCTGLLLFLSFAGCREALDIQADKVVSEVNKFGGRVSRQKGVGGPTPFSQRAYYTFSISFSEQPLTDTQLKSLMPTLSQIGIDALLLDGTQITDTSVQELKLLRLDRSLIDIGKSGITKRGAAQLLNHFPYATFKGLDTSELLGVDLKGGGVVRHQNCDQLLLNSDGSSLAIINRSSTALHRLDESSGTYGIFPGATAGAFSPDGKLFALGGSHVEVHSLLYEGPGFHLYGTPNPSALAFAADSKSIGVYSKETHVYQLVRTEGNLQHVNEFDSVPTLLVDGQFRHGNPLKELTDVYHPTTGRNKGTFPTEASDLQDCNGPPVHGYSVVSHDGTRCAWWQTGTISIGSLMPRKVLTCIPDPFSGRSPSTATFNATGTLLACGSSTGTESTVRVYQVSNREPIFERTYKSPLLHLALSGDGNRVAAAFKNGIVFWWRVDIAAPKNSGL